MKYRHYLDKGSLSILLWSCLADLRISRNSMISRLLTWKSTITGSTTNPKSSKGSAFSKWNPITKTPGILNSTPISTTLRLSARVSRILRGWIRLSGLIRMRVLLIIPVNTGPIALNITSSGKGMSLRKYSLISGTLPKPHSKESKTI